MVTSRALGLSPSPLPNVTSHCLFSLRAGFCLSHLALSPEHHGQRLPTSMTKNDPMVGMPFAEIRALPEREQQVRTQVCIFSPQTWDPSLFWLFPNTGYSLSWVSSSQGESKPTPRPWAHNRGEEQAWCAGLTDCKRQEAPGLPWEVAGQLPEATAARSLLGPPLGP